MHEDKLRFLRHGKTDWGFAVLWQRFFPIIVECWRLVAIKLPQRFIAISSKIHGKTPAFSTIFPV
tara:strand:- start:554 stop:748 length:195 start_codon:yes stop_codon:yes gene_type:complete